MIKKIGFSLLVAAFSPGSFTWAARLLTIGSPTTTLPVATTFTTTDTSSVSLAEGLNAPVLLGVDSARRVFPVHFCGEEVPVGHASVSRRWLQTIRAYGAQQECLYDLRQRASEFFPIIDPILRKYRIPRDFRYVPLAESALVNDCVSPKGAAGYWQLMPQTARELGLRVDDAVDERKDLHKATVAVCHYLHQLYRQLGSWTLVAAAYNGGIGHVRSRMERQQRDNYYQLRLHRETNHYLFRILAYKELLTNPRQYSLLISQRAIRYLTKPLPRWARRAEAPADVMEVAVTRPPQVDPNWGPRVNRTLTEVPSALEQWLAAAKGQPDPNDLTDQQSGMPITKLMGLMVLRFRRPRFLQWKKSLFRRPVHQWEWV